jgi:hypothetical protein
MFKKKRKKKGGTASIKKIYKKRRGNIGSCPHVPVRKFTWLDPIQCEKNTCTIFNQVQFSLKNRVQFYVIRQQMKLKKNSCAILRH